ncbi:MAG TPA: RluA family pseudouridine synthase [Candidatus Cloacimonetes bacterium]|nr:RluA family pseudouridine synthase [Candidatus Cloacimonadota bacterium]
MEIIYQEETSQRIDKYIVSLNDKRLYSRSFIDRLIKENQIRVNSKPVKKNHHLKKGEIINIEIPERTDLLPEPEDITLNIVYEDESLIIINKQAGLTVHPAPGNPKGTLVNALVYHFKDDLSSGNDKFRPGIIHRLDKNTSGLMIVAKNDRVHYLLSKMFQERKIEKYYQAIVTGVPAKREDTIITFINRSRKDRKKMSVADSGKKAITYYRVIKEFDFFSHLEVKLETGRTHQIRVHMSHLNCPVLGDGTYSNLKRTINQIPVHLQKKVKYLLANHLKRQALHSYRLSFEHPITGRAIDIEIDLPEDMRYTLEWLERNFSG